MTDHYRELLVVESTGAVLHPMTTQEANRVTAQIAAELDQIADHYETVMPLIRDAITREAHVALGYASVSAYVVDRFGGALTRLSGEMRRSVVHELSGAGMSTRAIAPVVGVSRQMVSKDLQVATRLPPEAVDGSAGVTGVTPAAVPNGTPEPAPTITGIDGKTYQRPTTIAEHAAEKARQAAADPAATYAAEKAKHERDAIEQINDWLGLLIDRLIVYSTNPGIAERDATRFVREDTNWRRPITPDDVKQAIDGLSNLANFWETR